MGALSLRDYFAVKAMQGLLSRGAAILPDVVSARSYEIADEMFNRSEESEPNTGDVEDDGEPGGGFDIFEIKGKVFMQISIGKETMQSEMPREEIESLIACLTNLLEEKNAKAKDE